MWFTRRHPRQGHLQYLLHHRNSRLITELCLQASHTHTYSHTHTHTHTEHPPTHTHTSHYPWLFMSSTMYPLLQSPTSAPLATSCFLSISQPFVFLLPILLSFLFLSSLHSPILPNKPLFHSLPFCAHFSSFFLMF